MSNRAAILYRGTVRAGAKGEMLTAGNTGRLTACPASGLAARRCNPASSGSQTQRGNRALPQSRTGRAARTRSCRTPVRRAWVRPRGIEPPRPRGHRLLKPARLPVPPRAHESPQQVSNLPPAAYEAAALPDELWRHQLGNLDSNQDERVRLPVQSRACCQLHHSPSLIRAILPAAPCESGGSSRR